MAARTNITDQARTAGQTGTTGRASTAEPARRSRRQLLARGTGAIAAVIAAEAIARPAPPRAAHRRPGPPGPAHTQTPGRENNKSHRGRGTPPWNRHGAR